MTDDQTTSNASYSNVGDTGFWGTVAVLIERRRVVLLASTALLVLGGITLILLAGPARYESRMSFFPQESEQHAAGLTGIAAQFGVALPPSGGATASPQFYARLVHSREILKSLVNSQYRLTVREGIVEGDLLTFFPSEEDVDTAVRRDRLIRRLRDDLIHAEVQRETGVVAVSVGAPNPQLAQQMSSRLLELVQAFNIRMRQSNAAAQRAFIQERLDTLGAALTTAEQRLQSFLERNREFRSSPELSFNFERLQREVDMRQQVVTSLAQSLEQAKIDEVRTTPVLAVLEHPEVPIRPQSRHYFRNALVIVIVAVIGGAIAGLMAEALHRDRQLPSPAYHRFRTALDQALSELRRFGTRRV